MRFLRASTAASVRIGPFVNATDAVTPITNLTLAGMTAAKLMKGGSAGTSIASLTWTHREDGYYDLALTATETATAGDRIRLEFRHSSFLPVWEDFHVLRADVYDALLASGTLAIFNVTPSVPISMVSPVDSALNITVFEDAAAPSVIWPAFTDSGGTVRDLSAASLKLSVFDPRTRTELFNRTSSGGQISATSGGVVTATYTATNTANGGTYEYALRITTTGEVLAHGSWLIAPMMGG